MREKEEFAVLYVCKCVSVVPLPAGGGREVARILALSMDTVVLVTLRTRDVKTPRYIAHLVSLL